MIKIKMLVRLRIMRSTWKSKGKCLRLWMKEQRKKPKMLLTVYLEQL
jgi:hypothetical protein